MTHLSCSAKGGEIEVDFTKKPQLLPHPDSPGVTDIWRPCYCTGCGENVGMLANVDGPTHSSGRLPN